MFSRFGGAKSTFVGLAHFASEPFNYYEGITLTLHQPNTAADIRASQISSLLRGPNINSVLATFDPAFYYLMKVLSEEGLGLISLLYFQESVWVNLYVDTLDVMPSKTEVREALSMLFTWVSLASYTSSTMCA